LPNQEVRSLRIVSGKTLLWMGIDPPKFIVSRFMPVGLHLLVGSPKVGKSWLALWLCHQVSAGESIWEFDTLKCGAANYTMLSAKYRAEQQQLKATAESMFAKLEAARENEVGAERWLGLIRKYEAIDELTAPLFNELIDRIEVHQPHKNESGQKITDIEIFYRFVGKID